MVTPLWMWIFFVVLILSLLALDLGIFCRQKSAQSASCTPSLSKSLWMTGFYLLVSLLFGGWIGYVLGLQSAAQYLTGFLVEKSLSLDNIFVISLIFSSLSIPLQNQRIVLFWGILGAVLLRGLFIGLGGYLISHLSWILYVFSALITLTGIKLLFSPPNAESPDIQKNLFLQWIRCYLPLTPHLVGRKFLVHLPITAQGKKRWHGTPLLLALILVESADLIFAIDSVPAIFTITQDPYIVYTSNVFAILGLRSLYFVLASFLERFYYLQVSLAVVLIFIGAKFFASDLFLIKIPPLLSLGGILLLLSWGVLYSLYKQKR